MRNGDPDHPTYPYPRELYRRSDSHLIHTIRVNVAEAVLHKSSLCLHTPHSPSVGLVCNETQGLWLILVKIALQPVAT